MLQVYHVQEAVRALWVFQGATHPTPLDHPAGLWDQQKPSVLGQHRAQAGKWSWGDSWPAFLGFLGHSRSRDIWWCEQIQNENQVCTRWAPGSFSRGSLVKMLWTEGPHSTLTVHILGWETSIFSQGDSEAGVITRHDCRIEVFWSCLLYIWHKIPCFSFAYAFFWTSCCMKAIMNYTNEQLNMNIYILKLISLIFIFHWERGRRYSMALFWIKRMLKSLCSSAVIKGGYLTQSWRITVLRLFQIS